MSYKYDVFLSYKSCDQEWVVKLKNALVKAGIKVWLDKDQIRPGDLFAEAIEEGLKSSETIAIIVSPEAMNSGWFKVEYYRAVSLAIKENPPQRVIPLLFCDAELPGFLKDRQWVDFRDENRFEISLQKLIWGIRGESKEQFEKTPKTIKRIEEENKQFKEQFEKAPKTQKTIEEEKKRIEEEYSILKMLLEKEQHDFANVKTDYEKTHEALKNKLENLTTAHESLVKYVKWGITSVIWILIVLALISIPWSGLELGIKILVVCVAVFGSVLALAIPLGWRKTLSILTMVGASASIIAAIVYLGIEYLA
ncbi:MAG: toll/interleukin-1 receptor domain-containing protein [Proteobacteria bacterium]|nr:toll/interleukin-1 receptor domain-containing protein [Pseudomonadota bacterium]